MLEIIIVEKFLETSTKESVLMLDLKRVLQSPFLGNNLFRE